MKRRKRDTETRNKKKKKREEKKREKERERERRKERKRKNGKLKNDERTSERTDGQFDGWMDGWILEWMNEWLEWGEKKNLKINFYKLYRQVACYADVLRVLFSLGKERMTKLLNWRLRGRLMSRSTLRASSPFGGVAKSHARTARRPKETRALPSLLELESLLVDYGRNDTLINKLCSIHHLLFCRCTS